MASPGKDDKATLSALPQEILENVFEQLGYDDRLNLRGVCKILKGIYETSAQLQYDFHLHISAHIDLPQSTTSTFLRTMANHVNSALSFNSDISPLHSDMTSDSNLSLHPNLPSSQLGSTLNSHVQPQPPISLNSDITPRNLAPNEPLIPPIVDSVGNGMNQRESIPSVRMPDWPTQSSVRKVGGVLSAGEKLDKLKERQKRWDTLDPVCRRKIEVDGPAGVYELQEGIFLMCDDYGDFDEHRPSSIRLIPLPSSADPDLNNPPLPTKSYKARFSIADLTMDPTQDLLVVSEYRPEASIPNGPPPTHRFHLLTLSSFTPHPLAQIPSLDFPPFSLGLTQTRQLIQVMGDTLCVLVSRSAPQWILAGLGVGMNFGAGGISGIDEELVAWNWKTGRVLARHAIVEAGWFASFALLSPTTFLLTTTHNVSPVLPTETRSVASVFPPVIQVYSLLSDPKSHINPVQPLGPDYLDDTSHRPVLVAQLELPAFVQGASVGGFDVRPDPPFPPSKPDPGSGIKLQKPFTQDPKKGVLVFELQVTEATPAGFQGDDVDGTSFELFILREMLVELGEKGEERWRRSWTERDFGFWNVLETLEWDVWASRARLQEVTMTRRNWVCSCSGYRFVSLLHSQLERRREVSRLNDQPPRKSDISILDFSPFTVRRLLSEASSSAILSDSSSDPSSNVDPTDKTVDKKNQSIPGSLEEKKVEVKIRVVDKPTILVHRQIWKEDVKSGLPFVEIIRKEGMAANGIMIDDQRVIVVSTHGTRSEQWTEMQMQQELNILCM
ncbi:hypothetical protein M231_02565 [Tremella mesenterica]|uniref:F-box domain-containing protein n=1 Tax=Tremella mesenterica TaxID=5217 RepID=A0A4Q1BQA3_TREME|nr:uncharacterized protein TREMEDRAFT_71382 [Tremella mesenterica DSM 1558]EIW70779.1 hypothetical protein TREMEDRAFT_71382 [Tremella mesenterica DSM 1558]RXK40108.1 hypothetical protein M231_02565 [Tremella mesenterica]